MWAGRAGHSPGELSSLQPHVTAEQGSAHISNPGALIHAGICWLAHTHTPGAALPWFLSHSEHSPCWKGTEGRGDTELISGAMSAANPSVQQQNSMTNRCAASSVYIRNIVLYPTFLALFLQLSGPFKDVLAESSSLELLHSGSRQLRPLDAQVFSP